MRRNDDDRDALAALYRATGSPNWKRSENWLTDAKYWEGMTVDSAGRVVALDLARNRMVGPIPPEIGRLTELRKLDLCGNGGRPNDPVGLSGPIPPEIGSLVALEDLSLSHSDLSGPIPRRSATSQR